jgi:hypothetical protein
LPDIYQEALSVRPNQFDSNNANKQTCVLQALDYSIVVERRFTGKSWRVTEITCPSKFRSLKTPYLAKIEAQLNQLFASPSRLKTLSKFTGFSRVRLFEPAPNFCHALRLDQGSGISFNNLCI